MYGEHRFLTDGALFSALGKPYSASLKFLPPEASMMINQNDHTCRILASQKVLRVFTEHGVIMRPETLCGIPEQGVLFTAACTEILAPKVRLLGGEIFGEATGWRP